MTDICDMSPNGEHKEEMSAGVSGNVGFTCIYCGRFEIDD